MSLFYDPDTAGSEGCTPQSKIAEVEMPHNIKVLAAMAELCVNLIQMKAEEDRTIALPFGFPSTGERGPEWSGSLLVWLKTEAEIEWNLEAVMPKAQLNFKYAEKNTAAEAAVADCTSNKDVYACWGYHCPKRVTMIKKEWENLFLNSAFEQDWATLEGWSSTL